MVGLTDEVLIFNDAKNVHSSALEQLENEDIRDAAEKAWCAVKRATDGLIVAATGVLPSNSSVTGIELKSLGGYYKEIRELISRYYTAQGSLHGECFYLGFCEPEELIRGQIYEVRDYIVDAEQLAERFKVQPHQDR